MGSMGYSDAKMNAITSYASSIAKRTVNLELAWHNRHNFKDDVDIETWLEIEADIIKSEIAELSKYLEPSPKYGKDWRYEK